MIPYKSIAMFNETFRFSSSATRRTLVLRSLRSLKLRMYTGVHSALDWNLVELNANDQRKGILHRSTASDCDIQHTNFIVESLPY